MTSQAKPTISERKSALVTRILAATDIYYLKSDNPDVRFSNHEIRRHWEGLSEARLKKAVKRVELGAELVTKSRTAETEDERCFWGHAANGVWIGSANPYDFALQLFPQFAGLVA